jgi:hypothetical protein
MIPMERKMQAVHFQCTTFLKDNSTVERKFFFIEKTTSIIRTKLVTLVLARNKG